MDEDALNEIAAKADSVLIDMIGRHPSELDATNVLLADIAISLRELSGRQ